MASAQAAQPIKKNATKIPRQKGSARANSTFVHAVNTLSMEARAAEVIPCDGERWQYEPKWEGAKRPIENPGRLGQRRIWTKRCLLRQFGAIPAGGQKQCHRYTDDSFYCHIHRSPTHRYSLGPTAGPWQVPGAGICPIVKPRRCVDCGRDRDLP